MNIIKCWDVTREHRGVDPIAICPRLIRSSSVNDDDGGLQRGTAMFDILLLLLWNLKLIYNDRCRLFQSEYWYVSLSRSQCLFCFDTKGLCYADDVKNKVYSVTLKEGFTDKVVIINLPSPLNHLTFKVICCLMLAYDMISKFIWF